MGETSSNHEGLKHEKLVREIRGRIRAGTLKPGDMLPSESQLCDEFKVSRGPVRQALAALTRDRMIYRVPGKGSFVSETASAPVTRDVVQLRVLVDASAGLDDNFVVLEIIGGLTDAVAKFGAAVKLSYEFHRFHSDHDLDPEQLAEGHDGLLVVPLTQYCVQFVESIGQSTVPVLTLFDRVGSGGMSNFFVDHEAAAYRATELLAQLGHDRIGYIADAFVPASFASRERQRGYGRAIEAAGQTPRIWTVGGTEGDHAKIRDGVLRQLQGEDPPTALIIGGGLLTPGVLQAVQAAGLTVPRDISLIAFDDTAEASLHDPPLCVIRQPLAKLAEAALEQLLDEVRGSAAGNLQRGFLPELVLRDSYSARR